MTTPNLETSRTKGPNALENNRLYMREWGRKNRDKRAAQQRKWLAKQKVKSLLAARFAVDNCLWCGGGASAHQVTTDRSGARVVECVDRHGDVIPSSAIPLSIRAISAL